MVRRYISVVSMRSLTRTFCLIAQGAGRLATMAPSLLWFRRDLRLADNPALLAAAGDGPVLPLFVLDPVLWGPAGPSRRAYLGASLRDLDARLRELGAGLSVVHGKPANRVVQAARTVGAERVHVAADYGPYGRQRDQDV